MSIQWNGIFGICAKFEWRLFVYFRQKSFTEFTPAYCLIEDINLVPVKVQSLSDNKKTFLKRSKKRFCFELGKTRLLFFYYFIFRFFKAFVNTWNARGSWDSRGPLENLLPTWIKNIKHISPNWRLAKCLYMRRSSKVHFWGTANRRSRYQIPIKHNAKLI